MNFPFPSPKPASPADQIQGRLLRLAALCLFFVSVVLTLSPAARAHTWEAPLRWGHWAGFAVWLAGFSAIHWRTSRALPDRDPYLIPLAALLSGLGLLTIWRLSIPFGIRQSIWLGVCLGLFWFGLRYADVPQWLRRYKYLWLTGGLLLLGLTFIFGVFPEGNNYGPRLWLGCCGIYLQPSEPLKLLLIVYLSAYLAEKLHLGFGGWRTLAPSLVLVGLALLLLLVQRDLGTASLFIALYIVILFAASGKKRYAAVSLIGLALALGLGYFYFDVVRLRVDAWLNPWADASGRSYQIVQSLIAFASGGFFGHGPGLGYPGLVPVAHSDFIFAVIGEELGLLGTVGVVLILALFAIRGLRTALRAPDPYRRYLTVGLTSYLIAQAILIAGGNLRLFPLTGVTLPFVSYGGSSLLTSFLSLFLLVQISSQSSEDTQVIVDPKPIQILGAVLLAGLAGIALFNGWWSVLRRDEIVARGDNLRPAIAEQYTPRGNILDRHGTAISMTTGGPGSYSRRIEYPALSPIVGYAQLPYGYTGLETSLNPYLRGYEGQPYPNIFTADLLYGQPPAGLDVRLTLDLDLQQAADALLDGHSGAAVLLNAQTGEILAMASHPGFDANRLQEDWEQLVNDPNAPLLNRASAGQYPLGAALGPFLLAHPDNSRQLPPLAQPLSLYASGQSIDCAVQPGGDLNWGTAIASGCPAPSYTLGQVIGQTGLKEYLQALGFYSSPNVPLMTAEAGQAIPSEDELSARLGLQNLRVSPLQAALAASALSTAGQIPAPYLMNAYRKTDGSWETTPNTGTVTQALPEGSARQAAQLLVDASRPGWGSVALARVENQKEITWYLGGTVPGWGGSPLALAVILEENNPQLAKEIGQRLLDSAMRQ